MDGNGDKVVSLNEMKILLEGTDQSLKDRLNGFSMEFEAHMTRQIIENFDLLDKDKNGSLDANEITQFFTP